MDWPNLIICDKEDLVLVKVQYSSLKMYKILYYLSKRNVHQIKTVNFLTATRMESIFIHFHFWKNQDVPLIINDSENANSFSFAASIFSEKRGFSGLTDKLLNQKFTSISIA